MTTLTRRGCVAALIALAAPRRSIAQQGRLTRLVIPYAPGGPTDTSARILADNLKSFSTFVVENRPGAGGRRSAAGRADWSSSTTRGSGRSTGAPRRCRASRDFPRVRCCCGVVATSVLLERTLRAVGTRSESRVRRAERTAGDLRNSFLGNESAKTCQPPVLSIRSRVTRS